jgi:DNA-binding NarL/FixJ family response regulator
MRTIRALIVDDHTVVVAGFERVLQADKRIHVVARASTLAESKLLMKRHTPDLVLLDLCLPDSRGAATIRAVRAAGRRAKIVAVTAVSGVTRADALAAGADAFLSKSTASDAILETIRRLFPGSSAAASPADDLSDRERQVARLAAEGLTNAEIGAILFISDNTVKTHLAHVLAKLRLKNRTDLASHWPR